MRTGGGGAGARLTRVVALALLLPMSYSALMPLMVATLRNVPDLVARTVMRTNAA